MKKIFWGYDPREVNDSIEFLESQNESLNAKLANLNLELLAKKEQLAAKEEAEKTMAVSAEEKKELVSLRSKVDKLTSENTRLQRECDSLRVQTPTPSVSQASSSGTSPENIDKVADIYKSVYANISNIQKDVSDEMKQFVGDYIAQLEKTNNQLRNKLLEIEDAKYEAKMSFIAVAEDILGKFEILTAEDSELYEKLDDVEAVKINLSSKISDLIERNETSVNDDEVEDFEEDMSDLPPLLSKALSERKKAEKQDGDKTAGTWYEGDKPKLKSV